MIRSFRDLEVYQESFQLQVEIDEEMKTFPQSERYLLIDQMRRASRGIPFAKHKRYIKEQDADEVITRYEKLAKKLTNLKNNWQNFK